MFFHLQQLGKRADEQSLLDFVKSTLHETIEIEFFWTFRIQTKSCAILVSRI